MPGKTKVQQIYEKLSPAAKYRVVAMCPEVS
jgi:hypothetical protein